MNQGSELFNHSGYNLEGAVFPGDVLLESGHLPLNSQEYLDQVTQKVDTGNLMEIV